MGNVVAKEVCIVPYIILLVFLVISFLAEDVKLRFINTIFVSGSINLITIAKQSSEIRFCCSMVYILS